MEIICVFVMGKVFEYQLLSSIVIVIFLSSYFCGFLSQFTDIYHSRIGYKVMEFLR